MPKARVTLPMRKIAMSVSFMLLGSSYDVPGYVTIASSRQFLDNTLERVVLCTATNVICANTTPQASASGNASAGCTL